MQKIAFQGQLGAYSHLACKHVNPDAQAVPYDSFVQAISAVECGDAKRAMIPLENSSAGRVEEIYRQIPKTHLNIVAEHFQPVSHCLMALPDAVPSWVMSHPQALAQCHDKIIALGLEPRAEFDTAGAAKLLAKDGDLTGSVVASELAADLYGLNIIERQFEDITGNTTRFIVLMKDSAVREYDASKTYVTSILFTLRNIPAALYKALGGFATNGLNLIKIESYLNSNTLNSSQFHIDVAQHIDTQAMQNAIEELQFYASQYRWLGTYESHEFRR
ncbi:MAG: prephenate dehydratase [Bermanella sp.]|nr:prephenate dehydratase [Bermanella sp.]|tara:strand:- start:894 stop:1718 length:825 start_codon:yes stop_codon:yes gene_type:complete